MVEADLPFPDGEFDLYLSLFGTMNHFVEIENVLREMQRETAAGRLPTGSLVDGAILLVAGALLVTPGVLTDVFGFLCLVPGFRALAKRALFRRLERAVREGHVEMRVYTQDPWGPREEKVVRDIDAGPEG